MKRQRLFLINASVMTATSLLLSGAGVWFNLYISRKLGAQGLGVFQLMMSAYSLAVTVATSGIHLACTRLVAQESAGNSGAGVKSAVRRCLAYSLLFGCLSGAALYFGAPVIGVRWLHAQETIRPLRVMAFGMPLLAMSCALNGYFTAVRRVVKSAAGQILEQFMRITLTAGLLSFVAPPGLENACIAITCSGVVAEGASFLLELVLYLADSRRFSHKGHKTSGQTQRLLAIALPVAFSSYLRSGLTSMKNFLVPVRLQAGGLTPAQSLANFGVLHGVVLPVILFPYAFLNAFNSLIVPELAQSIERRQSVNGMVQKMFGFTLGFGLGMCGVLFAFSNEIGAAVSQNSSVGPYIRLLAPVVPLMYLDTAVDSMLKGMDEQISVMRYNVMDALLSLAGVYILLPVFGIKGYIFVIFASEVFNLSLSLHRLIAVAQVRFDLYERFIKPLLCIAIAVLLTALILRLGWLPQQVLWRAASLMLLCAGLYLSLLHVSGWRYYDT